MADSPYKIQSGKSRSVGSHVGKCSDLDKGTHGSSKDTQKKQTRKDLLLTDSEGSKSDEDHGEYFLQSTEGIVKRKPLTVVVRRLYQMGVMIRRLFPLEGRKVTLL